MSIFDISVNDSVAKNVTRKDMSEFQDELLSRDNILVGKDTELVCPVKHYFADGLYVREIFIPKGLDVLGKIHKEGNPNFLLKGSMYLITEHGKEIIEAPCFMMSQSGIQKAAYTITDCTWITVHSNPSNTNDLEKVEEYIISKSYEELDRYLELKKSKNLFQKGLIYVKHLITNR